MQINHEISTATELNLQSRVSEVVEGGTVSGEKLALW